MFRNFGRRRLSIQVVVGFVLATIMVATATLVYLTLDAVAKGEETQKGLVSAANQTVLLEDIRAEYLSAWLLIVSANGMLDDRFIERFERARARADWGFAQLIDNSEEMAPEEADRMRELAERHQELTRSWTPVLTLLSEGKGEDAHAALSDGVLQLGDAFVDDLATEVQRHRLGLNRALVDSKDSRSLWKTSAFTIGGLWIVLLFGGAYTAHRWLLRPLNQLAGATRLMAAGDVTFLAPVGGPAEIARLAGDVNMMAVSLISRSKELNDYLAKDLEVVNEALRASEDRLNAVIESAPVILFALDTAGTYTMSKGRGLAAFGLEPGGIDGMSAYEVFRDDPKVCADIRRALAGEPVTTEMRIRDLVFETHLAPLGAEAGPQAGVIGVAMDLTERKRAEEALRESEERYRELFQNANDIIYTHDLEGRFTSMNKAGATVSGYREDEIRTMSIADLMTHEMLEVALEMLRRKLGGQAERTTYDLEIVSKDGEVVPLEVSSRLVLENETPAAIQGIARDISERRKAEKALRDYALELEALNEQIAAAHVDLAQSKQEIEEKSRQLERALELERAQSRIDPLTGALNHGAIVNELRELVEKGPDGARAAVVMADIDDMKAANDVYGHPFGDQVLIAVKEALTREDVTVGRYGGDEFVAIVKDAGKTEAEAYRQEVLEAIRHSGLRDPEAGTEVSIVVSIGYCVYPKEAQRIEDLIALADSAMYAHKRQRPILAVDASTRRLGGEPVVRALGEIVPVLTSSGDLKTRLALVAERLAASFEYQAVEIFVNPWRAAGKEVFVTFPEMPDEVTRQRMIARRVSGGAIGNMLEKTQRAVIIDDPQGDERLDDFQRALSASLGIRTVVIAPLFWEGHHIGSLSATSAEPHAFGPIDGQLLMGIASQLSAIVSMAALLEDYRGRSLKLTSAHAEGVRLLAWVVEAQAGVPSHDFERMRTVSEAIARRLGLGQDEAEQTGLATMLHDIGKFRVPPAVLGRPQDLTEDEWDIVRRHTIWGHRLLREHPAFELASQVARWHHERWDGHGYPDGLAGDEIPLAVAIASVADALDAMVYDRVYREGMSASAALAELIAGAGSHFNPRVVDALVQLYDEGGLPLLPSRQDGSSTAA